MIASQTCDDCGDTWPVRYTGDGGYAYLPDAAPCDCESTFTAEAGTPSVTQAGECAGCGVALRLDETASFWLGRSVWYDRDAVDGASDALISGRECLNTGDAHYPSGDTQ